MTLLNVFLNQIIKNNTTLFASFCNIGISALTIKKQTNWILASCKAMAYSSGTIPGVSHVINAIEYRKLTEKIFENKKIKFFLHMMKHFFDGHSDLLILTHLLMTTEPIGSKIRSALSVAFLIIVLNNTIIESKFDASKFFYQKKYL